MRNSFAFLWRWSWLATVPCCAAFVFWGMTTFQRWRTFCVDYDSRPQQPSLHAIGVDRWHSMLRRARIALQGTDLNDVPNDLQLRSIQLFAAEADLARLNDDLPYSGFDFVDALLAYPDGLHEVKLRYRGDFLNHWGYEKKSLRIRTRTDDLFGGLRAFNLIAPKFPEQLNNYLAYRLAGRMGLIAPRCDLVNVFLNGRNVGMHVFTEQLDEGTLREHDRMPGDLYAGELIAKDVYRGITDLVFDHPALWEKLAANNHYDLESRAPLEALLCVLRGSPSEAAHAELSRLLDMDAWGRFGAFQLIAQTHHFDEVHNWRLFWDPWRLKFEPIVWDPTGWTPDSRAADGVTVAADLVTSRLHQWLVGNGDYLAARHAALREFLTGGGKEPFLAEVDVALAKARRALSHDPNLRPTDSAEVGQAMAALRPYMDQILTALAAAHLDEPGRVRWARADAETVRLEVLGRRPVDGVRLQLQRPVPAATAVKLRIRRLGSVHEVDLSAGVAVEGATLRFPARLFCQLVPEFRFLPGQVLRQNGRRPDVGTYDLCVAGLPADNSVVEVAVDRAGRSEVALPAASIPPRELEFVYRATAPLRSAAPQVWRGDVVVEGVREVQDDVTIEPGTTIRMGPGASLLFRGRVAARGARERPIRFVPQGPDQAPWGTVAINGPGCGGSRFQWCELRGGSGYKVPLEEYCSMFSIHNCSDVRVEDCWFGENHQYDDLVHVMYSAVAFERVTLDGARADALDCDISTVVVRNSDFLRSGNDGIDLMTTNALVHDCRFEGNGDKGISIGEGSRLVAVRDRFAGCNKGLEAKDGSIACVANCEIRGCQRALNAYKKNWRYASGGFLTVHKSTLLGNDVLPTADRWSRARLVDCRVEGQPVAEYEQEYVDGTSTRMPNAAEFVDSDGEVPARSGAALPFPGDLQALRELAGEVWSTVRSDVRGVPSDR